MIIENYFYFLTQLALILRFLKKDIRVRIIEVCPMVCIFKKKINKEEDIGI